MDKFACFSSFVCAVDEQSFVAAGRLLGISASAVGKNVARLEAHLGTRLLQRSTRRIHLTQEGSDFYRSCRDILSAVGSAEAMLSSRAESPSGRLRLSVIVVGYRFLMPILADFSRSYPEVELDLDFDDRVVDIVGENFDAVIRSGELRDSRLMVRCIGAYEVSLYASASYLERNGMPKRFRDLERHACIRFRNHTRGTLQGWGALTGETDTRWLPETIICNNIEATLAATVNGLGVGYMPDFVARQAVADGRLTPILGSHRAEGGRFYVVWPASPQTPARLRVFLDFLEQRTQSRLI